MSIANLLAAGLMLGGVGAAVLIWRDRDVDVFDQPPALATERLLRARRAVDGTGLGGLDLQAAGRDGEAVLVRVTRAGDPRGATCHVTVGVGAANRSRVRTNCTQPDGTPTNGADGPVRRVATDALALVVREHAAAAIQDRAYDIDRVATRVIGLVLLNRPAIAAGLRIPD